MKTNGMILSAVAFVAVCTAAQAGPSEALAFAIGQCSSQPDEKTRLACYDRIAEQLKMGSFMSAPQATASPPPFVSVPTPGSSVQPPVSTPPPVAVAQPAAPPAVAQAPETRRESSSWYDPTSWFGKDKPERTSNNPADFGAESIQKTRTASAEPGAPEEIDEIRAGVKSVFFSPTQRFTVTLDNGQIWRQLDGDTGVAHFEKKGGDVVTISRGILGSYNLVVAGHTMLFKVKRIR